MAPITVLSDWHLNCERGHGAHNPQKNPADAGLFNQCGANDGARTHGNLGHNQVLYQLSYIRHMQKECLYQRDSEVKPSDTIF